MGDGAGRQRLIGALVLAAIVIFLDQVSKSVILHQVMQPPRVIPIVPGFFNLTLTFNTGVSFGIFSGSTAAWQPYALSLLAVAVSLVMLVWLWREDERWKTLSIGLIVGGAIGNVIDRLIRPGVVDFLDFHVGGWHWPAFNVADSAITVGVVILLVASLFPGAGESKSEQGGTPS